MSLISALLALLASFSSFPSAARSPLGATRATLARLQVTVTTSSDWSGLEFTAGRVWAQKVSSSSGGPTVSPTQRGFTVDATPGSNSTAVVTLVYEASSALSSLQLKLTKGAVGSTYVKVRNTSTTRSFDVTSFIAGSEIQQRIVNLARLALFGRADPAMPRADARRLVLAAYYPWWGPGAYADPRLSDRPADRRFTTDAEDVLSMARQAKDHGIDGFVMSWAGDEENGAALDLLLSAQEQTGGTTSIYLETRQAAPEAGRTPSAAVLKQWITEAVARSTSPAFLTSGGKPVVFVFEMGLLGPAAWRSILDQLAKEGHPVRLVGDATTDNYLSVSWGFHQYDPNPQSIFDLATWNRSFSLATRLLNSPSPSDHLFAATVSPGFDDQAARGTTNPIVPRGANGERYAGTWKAALAAAPEWILVTSWNEWIEGTHVEPGAETGDLALRQTDSFAARFHAGTGQSRLGSPVGLRPVGPRTPSSSR
ncbi:MAG: glycoside hydrolase family 99-like domain-containing protein [Actinomycetota bacterium]